MMDGMYRGAIAIALLFLAAGGCSRHAAAPDATALDSAYRAGVITRDEYNAKKAALQAQTAQLAALDKAMHAGLLTPSDYAAKKAALLASPVAAPPVAASPAPALSAPATPAAGPAVAPPQPATLDASANPAPPPAPDTAGPPPAAAAGVYRMKMAQIVDAQGFGQPIPSASILVPVDWKTQGATTWNIKDRCNGVQTHFVATGPDGHAFERFPVYTWVWADDPRPLQVSFQQSAQMGTHACDVMAPMSAQDYLRRNLARLRPGAQLSGFESAPKLMADLQDQARQTEAMAQRYNLRQQVKFDAIKARVTYNLDGKPVEEWVLAATVTTGTFGPLGRWSYNCVAYSAGQRAPAGKLESSEPLFQLIASTFRVNPAWQARMNQNAQAMQQIQLKGIRDRSAIVAKSAEDQRNIQRQGYENQQKAEDRSSTQQSQYMRGIESYRNPSTGETVDLDSRYGHAWVNGSGEYLLSDQAAFDPNSVHGNTQNWTQLQHVKQ